MEKELHLTERYGTVIRQCPLFSGADAAELLQLLEWMQYTFSSYQKNSCLHRCGEGFERFGLVVFGRVKVMIDDIEGNSAIMAEVTPGNTFGESLCFLKRDYSELTVCAAEDTGVIWLSPGNLFRGNSSGRIAELERRFVEMLAARTLSMNNRIQILSKLTLREKIITYFTFAAQNAKKSSLEVSLSREEMAIYFGTNRSALSRELSRMKKEGLIDFSGKHFQLKL